MFDFLSALPIERSVPRPFITSNTDCKRAPTFVLFSSFVASLALATAYLGGNALAYNPPVDTVDGVTVRIEGPSEIRTIAEPFVAKVVVENKSDAPLHARVRPGVIDDWSAEPAERDLTVAAGDTAAVQFSIQPSKQTHNAWYPVHTFVVGKLGEKPWAAHPILLLQAKHPNPPTATRVLPWLPVLVDAESTLALWQIPTYRAVVEVFDHPPEVMPVGWKGAHATNGASLVVEPGIVVGGRAEPGFREHPPWKDGQAGTLTIEIPLKLPKTSPIVLRFANGVPDDHSDGVTFRVSVVPFDAPNGTSGDPIFDRHVAPGKFENGEADLSSWAGHEIRLQLQVHPGPNKNTGWDQCCWGRPTLVCGTPPSKPPFPPASNDGAVILGGGRIGSQPCTYWVRPGKRGLLDAVVGIECNGKTLYLDGFHVRVLGMNLEDADSPCQLREITIDRPDGKTLTATHALSSPLGNLTLIGTITVRNGVLDTAFQLIEAPPDRPWFHAYIEEIALGRWSEPIEAVYAGPGNVVVKPEAYRLRFDGHRLATSFVGTDLGNDWHIVHGTNNPPTELVTAPERRHVSLYVPHDSRLTIIPAESVWSGACRWHDVNGLEAADGVPAAAGRFVFDLWGGRYADSDRALRKSLRYGLTHSMVVWHNWQRWGYDYRLPEIYPPNPQWGTEAELKQMIETCKASGVPFALHDNYIDFYPDAQGFSYKTVIAFAADGRPVPAWYNQGRDAQSYRYRADAVEPFLRANLEVIRANLAPTAYFIDVWSSIQPYDYWTSDGRFVDRVFTRNSWGDHFAWIREFLGNHAPQISESGHDQLIGKLDGAQTNHLRVGEPTEGYYKWAVWNWKCADAERIPWFDAAHHDRFVLHGAGYSGRYQAGLDAKMHGIYSDDYIATEVLTGHPPMVPEPFSRDCVRKYWLLSTFARAVALDRIRNVDFVDGNIHRQFVEWENGTRVWVNRGSGDWIVNDHILPSYGFLAIGRSQDGPWSIAIEKRNGIITEICKTVKSIYVNGRKPHRDRFPAKVAVRGFRDLGDGKFQLDLQWDCERPVPAEYRPFLHLCDEQGEIVFQAQHQPNIFDGTRSGRFGAAAFGIVPEERRATAGHYELRVGFYMPNGGRRLDIEGVQDGEHRTRLGTLIVTPSEKGPQLGWEPLPAQADPYERRINPTGKPIDFGCIVTAGALKLERTGDTLQVIPLPTPPDDTTECELVWDALPWSVPPCSRIDYLDEAGNIVRQESRSPIGGRLSLTIPGSVFAVQLSP